MPPAAHTYYPVVTLPLLLLLSYPVMRQSSRATHNKTFLWMFLILSYTFRLLDHVCCAAALLLPDHLLIRSAMIAMYRFFCSLVPRCCNSNLRSESSCAAVATARGALRPLLLPRLVYRCAMPLGQDCSCHRYGTAAAVESLLDLPCPAGAAAVAEANISNAVAAADHC